MSLHSDAENLRKEVKNFIKVFKEETWLGRLCNYLVKLFGEKNEKDTSDRRSGN